MVQLVEKLAAEQSLTHEELVRLIRDRDDATARLLAQKAADRRRGYYGDRVILRGLIEFTSFCKNDCYYCGLRRSNRKLSRYRLTGEQILAQCGKGYALGFRSFVLQGGEDPGYSPRSIAQVVSAIKDRWPDTAVTLSAGERSRDTYRLWRDAGADRYLLREETADRDHYGTLHPGDMSYENRIRCLYDLKELGYQVGCGFMVGSPGQGTEQIVRDLELIRLFQPHMVGIGPFIPQKDTPFAGEGTGSAGLTCYLLSIIRLLVPKAMIPATTALNTVHPQGRAWGLRSGANVCMPDLSPVQVRGQYAIYDRKLCTGLEAAEEVEALKEQIRSLGLLPDTGRGDHIDLR